MRAFIKKLISVVFVAVIVISAVVAVNIGKNFFVDTAAELGDEPPAKITDTGSPYKHYYDDLENTEKHVYNRIISNIYGMPERIRIPFIEIEQLDKVFTALLYDNPDLFFVARRCSIVTRLSGTYCTIDYLITPEEYAEQKEKLDAVCNKVIASLDGIDDPWQKELRIHDYIVDNCKYVHVDGELTYSSSYGALVNGEAACEGYTKAMKLLLDKAGIESSIVSGIVDDPNGNPGNHMWNVVKLGDDFYHTDCTWNDPVSDTGEQMKLYAYFNLSDEVISRTHADFSKEFNCNSMAENYYVKTGSYFETYAQADVKSLADAVAKTLNRGENDVQLRFGSTKAYNEAVADLITNGRIYDVLARAKNKTSAVFSTDSLTYYKDKEQCVINFTLNVTGRYEFTNG